MKKTIKNILIILALLTSSCGEDNNLLGYLITNSQEEASDTLISQAEHYYDKGKFKKALKLAQKAHEINKDSEKAAVLLGFIYFGLAKMDPFSLAENLINQAEEDKDDDSSSTNDDNSLSKLENLLGFNADVFAKLALENNQKEIGDGTIIQGAPTEGVFAEYPVLLPKTAPEARASGTETLFYLSKAIEAICPFIYEGVKVLGEVSDPRHTSDVCPPTQLPLSFSGKTHFLWALAHLTEAVAFNSVILYDPTGEGPNLIRRSEALKSFQPTDLLSYISSVAELAQVLNIILPVDPDESKNSMLMAIINNLETANKAFKALPGIPKTITSVVDESLNEIEEQRKKISNVQTNQNEVSERSRALKEQLTQGLSKNIREQITNKAENGELTEDNKKELCEAYSSISTEKFETCSEE